MTDPLIDRDALIAVVRIPANPGETVDAVLAYLREVLTPETLQTTGEWEMERDGVRWARVTTPDDLHRRIFGEDG